VDVNIKLDQFEGPLDLLLHLIDKAEVDIYEIPIAKIADQYMDILFAAEELELEMASQFLVMAATLLAIKSKMLLPQPALLEKERTSTAEEWLDPREELVERLLEYKRYKRLGEVLQEREAERSKIYSRLPLDLTRYASEVNPVEGLNPDDLLQALAEVLQHRKPADEPFTHVARAEFSIGDRMKEIYQELSQQETLFFKKLFIWEKVNKEWVITTFLALLELMRLKRIVCRQSHLFGEIRIEKWEVNEIGAS
jgi:segregation and condensation protein A